MVTSLVAWAYSGLQDEDLLFPFTYENYRRFLKKVTTDILHLDIHWTPQCTRRFCERRSGSEQTVHGDQ